MLKFMFTYKIFLLIFMISLGVSIDQYSKSLVKEKIFQEYYISLNKSKYCSSKIIILVPNNINIIYQENNAAAFSLANEIPLNIRKLILITANIISIIFCLIWFFYIKNTDIILTIFLPFILVGSVSNFIDRVQLGYVIDYLDIYSNFFSLKQFHWPIFNIADFFIVVGIIAIIIDVMFFAKRIK